jgi:hypothetical protein
VEAVVGDRPAAAAAAAVVAAGNFYKIPKAILNYI